MSDDPFNGTYDDGTEPKTNRDWLIRLDERLKGLGRSLSHQRSEMDDLNKRFRQFELNQQAMGSLLDGLTREQKQIVDDHGLFTKQLQTLTRLTGADSPETLRANNRWVTETREEQERRAEEDQHVLTERRVASRSHWMSVAGLVLSGLTLCVFILMHFL